MPTLEKLPRPITKCFLNPLEELFLAEFKQLARRRWLHHPDECRALASKWQHCDRAIFGETLECPIAYCLTRLQVSYHRVLVVADPACADADHFPHARIRTIGDDQQRASQFLRAVIAFYSDLHCIAARRYGDDACRADKIQVLLLHHGGAQYATQYAVYDNVAERLDFLLCRVDMGESEATTVGYVNTGHRRC